MNGEDILKLIGFLVVAMLVIHYFISCVHVQTSVIEGLTNADTTTTTTDTNSTSTTTGPSNGVAGSAANYAASIKAKTVQLQDELLISKYRKDYEAAIINMDDYINMLMLKQVLSMTSKVSPNAVFQTLTMLKSSKDALNSTMKFLDTQ
jgi:hypothetical protein